MRNATWPRGRQGAGYGLRSLAVPKGPRGEQRPADLIGNAVHIARIATGEIEDAKYEQPNKVRAGRAGGRARSASLTPDERSAIARKARAARRDRD